MGDVFTNNAYTTLAADIDGVATSLTLAAGTGIEWPTPTPGQTISLVVVHKTTGAKECMRATTRSTDTISGITRAVEAIDGAQVARSFPAGSYVYNTPFASFWNGFAVKADIQSGSVGTATVVGGTGSAIVLTFDPAITTPVDQQRLAFRAAAANGSGGTTLKSDSAATAYSVKKTVDGVRVALDANDITADDLYIVQWDADDSEWVLTNPNAPDAAYLLSQANQWQKPQRHSVLTLTDAATVNWNLDNGAVAQVMLGGNRTFAFSGTKLDGQNYTLRIIQDGTGGRTITWPDSTVLDWGNFGPPVLSAAAGAMDIISLHSDGQKMYALWATGFSTAT